MRHREPRAVAWRALVGLAAVLTLAAATESRAAEAKNYAYFLLQGRIAGRLESTFLEGATVRLTAGSDVFEAKTDDRGVFLFEKIPVQPYDLTITTADGEVIRTLERVDLGDPHRTRLRIRLGQGPGRKARVGAGENQIVVDTADRPPKWSRFWKQFAIVVGAAAVLAL